MRQTLIGMSVVSLLFIYGCGNADVESAMYSKMGGEVVCKQWRSHSLHRISKVTSKHGTVKDAWYVTIEWACGWSYFCETYEVMFKNGKIIQIIQGPYDLRNPYEKSWGLWILMFVMFFVLLWFFISELGRPSPYAVVCEYAKRKFPCKFQPDWVVKCAIGVVPGVLFVWIVLSTLMSIYKHAYLIISDLCSK